MTVFVYILNGDENESQELNTANIIGIRFLTYVLDIYKISLAWK